MTDWKKYTEIIKGLTPDGAGDDLRRYGNTPPPCIKKVKDLTDSLVALMFYCLLDLGVLRDLKLKWRARRALLLLKGEIRRVTALPPQRTHRLAWELLSLVPKVKKDLILDAESIYRADPATSSVCEVVICYPGFYATAVYRLAHELYLMKIPYIPRIMTEYAHEKTGIDIHPGATIGEGFCIDHGTGVVIGETAVIGKNVRIYQGVTLGAKSLPHKENENALSGAKRHPEIGDNCIIYANATILGGDTVIGDGCTIGGNVWLTRSVPEGSKIIYDKK